MGDSHNHHSSSSQQRSGKSGKTSSSRSGTWGSGFSSLKDGKLPRLTDKDPQTFHFTDTSRPVPQSLLPDSPSSQELLTASPAGSSSERARGGIRRASGSSYTETKQEQKKFRCDKCHKSYTTKYSLGLHVRSVHEKIKVLCENHLCQQPFVDKSRAVRHYKDHHLPEKRGDHPVVCKICGAHFSTKSSLGYHRKQARGH